MSGDINNINARLDRIGTALEHLQEVFQPQLSQLNERLAEVERFTGYSLEQRASGKLDEIERIFRERTFEVFPLIAEIYQEQILHQKHIQKSFGFSPELLNRMETIWTQVFRESNESILQRGKLQVADVFIEAAVQQKEFALILKAKSWLPDTEELKQATNENWESLANSYLYRREISLHNAKAKTIYQEAKKLYQESKFDAAREKALEALPLASEKNKGKIQELLGNIQTIEEEARSSLNAAETALAEGDLGKAHKEALLVKKAGFAIHQSQAMEVLARCADVDQESEFAARLARIEDLIVGEEFAVAEEAIAGLLQEKGENPDLTSLKEKLAEKQREVQLLNKLADAKKKVEAGDIQEAKGILIDLITDSSERIASGATALLQEIREQQIEQQRTTQQKLTLADEGARSLFEKAKKQLAEGKYFAAMETAKMAQEKANQELNNEIERFIAASNIPVSTTILPPPPALVGGTGESSSTDSSTTGSENTEHELPPPVALSATQAAEPNRETASDLLPPPIIQVAEPTAAKTESAGDGTEIEQPELSQITQADESALKTAVNLPPASIIQAEEPTATKAESAGKATGIDQQEFSQILGKIRGKINSIPGMAKNLLLEVSERGSELSPQQKRQINQLINQLNPKLWGVDKLELLK